MKRFIIVTVLLALVILLIALGGRDAPPPDVSDLSLPPLTDGGEANACSFFREAANRLYCPVDTGVLHDMMAGTTNAPKLVATLVASNQQAFAQLDRGLNCQICILPAPDTDSDMPAEQCRNWIKMGCILWLQAQRELELGQLEAASVTCGRLIRFGGLVQQEPQTLLQFLIGQTILGQGFWQIRILANHPEVTSRQLQRLAQQLDALAPPDKKLKRPFLVMFHLNASLLNQIKASPETFMDNTVNARGRLRVARFFFTPYFFKPNATMGHLANHYRKAMANLSQPYATIKHQFQPVYPKTKLGRLVWWIRPNAVGRLFLLFDNDLIALGGIQSDSACSYYGTRLVLACRSYRLKHGEWPSALAVLMPDHLASIPSDPYDGASFRYSRDKAIVYAVGKDLKDDGGEESNGSGLVGDDIVFPLVERK